MFLTEIKENIEFYTNMMVWSCKPLIYQTWVINLTVIIVIKGLRHLIAKIKGLKHSNLWRDSVPLKKSFKFIWIKNLFDFDKAANVNPKTKSSNIMLLDKKTYFVQ